MSGHRPHDKGRTFATILDTLDGMGYDVAWQVYHRHFLRSPNSADFKVPQSRKRVFIIGFLRGKCTGRVLSFSDANPKTLVQRVSGREGNRIYSIFGLSITLTSQAGGFGGKTGLYEIMGLPIKSKTKQGYQVVFPGECVTAQDDFMVEPKNKISEKIKNEFAQSGHRPQGYYFVYCMDLNPQPKITELARCITTRQDNGICNRQGEKSGLIYISKEPIAVLTPDRENVRQQGRRFKLPGEPMFTITVMDRHGVVYMGYIRKLIPLECWRLQGFTDEQFNKVKAVGISDAQLYKQAGNAVTVNVVEVLARKILEFDKENASGEKNKNI